MSARIKLIVGFVFLEIIDFFPLPVTSLVALYIVLKKPPWFKNLVMELYQNNDDQSMQ